MLLPSTLRQVRSQACPIQYSVAYICGGKAMTAASCLRSLAGFVFPLFAPAMYSALGFCKGDTVFAAVAIAIGCPA